VAILNYTTTVAVNRSVGAIHAKLVEAGARSITTEYSEVGTAVGVSFMVETVHGPRQFSLPVNTTGVERALQRDRVPNRYRTTEHAERVAWRILKDWIEAQLAVIDAGMATLDQVMLPYMLGVEGRSVYELYRDQQLALPAP
jgi:hypothetical protein